MKKLLLAAAALLMGATASFAQDNKGIELGAAMSGQALGAQVRYAFDENIRLEGNALYAIDGAEKQNSFNFNVNAHYLFTATENVTVYPLLGLNIQKTFISGVTTKAGLGANFGFGISYQVVPNLSFGTEFKQVYGFEEGRRHLMPALSANVMFKL